MFKNLQFLIHEQLQQQDDHPESSESKRDSLPSNLLHESATSGFGQNPQQQLHSQQQQQHQLHGIQDDLQGTERPQQSESIILSQAMKYDESQIRNIKHQKQQQQQQQQKKGSLQLDTSIEIENVKKVNGTLENIGSRTGGKQYPKISCDIPADEANLSNSESMQEPSTSVKRSTDGNNHRLNQINPFSSSNDPASNVVPSGVFKGFVQAKTIYQTNGQRLWGIVRRDIYFPIKFHGKVETGLVKKRRKKFKGTQVQAHSDSKSCFFIHPHGGFKQGWDVFTGLAHLYFPIMLPMRIAFEIEMEDYYVIDISLEIVFLLDMIFSCVTGIIVGGELIRDRFLLSKKYFRTNFIWDLIMIIPYQFFMGSLGYVKIFRLARYWDRFLFLLHKTVYFVFKGGSSHKFAVLLYYLFKVSTLILLIVHVLTCVWIQAGMEKDYGVTDEMPSNFIQEGWVNTYYRLHTDRPQIGEFNLDVYISGYYFVTTTIATVGYGDFSSHTVMESLFTMFCEFFGIALFGYISGGLVSAVKMSLLVGTLKRSENKNLFENWLYQREKNKIEPLDKAVHKHLRAINGFNAMYNFSDFFHETEFFHYMPKEQKRKVFNLLFTDIASFFRGFFRNITELSMIQDIFGFMHPLTFLPGGEIIRSQSFSKGIYFIVSGKVYISCRTNKVDVAKEMSSTEKCLQESTAASAHAPVKDKFNFHKLRSGSFFGEFCILEKSSQVGFIAGGPEPLLTLFITKSKMIDICMKYKETFAWLKQFAFYRQKYFTMEKNDFVRRKQMATQIGQSPNKLYKEPEMTIWEQPQLEESEQNQSIEIDSVLQMGEKMHSERVKQSNENNVSIEKSERMYTDDVVLEINPTDNSDLENASLFPINSGRNIYEEGPLNLVYPAKPLKSFLSEVPAKMSKQPSILQGGGIDIPAESASQKQRGDRGIITHHHKSNKSDIEVFMQKGPDFFFAENMKQHVRMRSCTIASQKERSKTSSFSSSHEHNSHKLADDEIIQFPSSTSIHSQKLSNQGSLPQVQQQEQVQVPTSNNQSRNIVQIPLDAPPNLSNRFFKHPKAITSNPNISSQSNDSPPPPPPPLRQQTMEESSTFQSLQFEEFTEKSNGILPIFRSNLDSHNLFNSDKNHRYFDRNGAVVTATVVATSAAASQPQTSNSLSEQQPRETTTTKSTATICGSPSHQFKRKLLFNQSISKEWNFDAGNNAASTNNAPALDRLPSDENIKISSDLDSNNLMNTQISQARSLFYPETMLPTITTTTTTTAEKESRVKIIESEVLQQQQSQSSSQQNSNSNLNQNVHHTMLYTRLNMSSENKENLERSEINSKMQSSRSSQSRSLTSSSEYFDSEEEQKIDDMIQKQQLVGGERRKSLYPFQEIFRQEKKLRNAFKSLLNENLHDDAVPGKNAMKLIQQAGIEDVFNLKQAESQSSSSSMLSSLHLQKHKLMKKFLQKKIDLLVSHQSEICSQVQQQQQQSNQASSEISSFKSNSHNSNQASLTSFTNRLMMRSSTGLAYPKFKQAPSRQSTNNKQEGREDNHQQQQHQQETSSHFSCYSKKRGTQHRTMVLESSSKSWVNRSGDIGALNSSDGNKGLHAMQTGTAYSETNSGAIGDALYLGECKDDQMNSQQFPQFQAQSMPLEEMSSENSEIRKPRKKKEVAFADTTKEQLLQQMAIPNNNNMKQQQESLSEVGEEEEESIEQQMENIQASRFPNFELMLYIDRMIQRHEEEYKQEVANNEADDYQCYDEIENSEQEKDCDFSEQTFNGYSVGNSAYSALDSSIDIPIENVKPDFSTEDLLSISSYLDNQMTALEIKMNQIVESVYDECMDCVDKINSLNSQRSKIQKQLETKEEHAAKSERKIQLDSQEQHSPQLNQGSFASPSIAPNGSESHSPPQRALTKTLGFAKQIVQNNIISKNLMQSSKNTNEEGHNNIDGQEFRKPSIVVLDKGSGGRVNLGLNIEFSLNQALEKGDEDQENVEYNFFTELDRKNQLHRNKLNARAQSNQIDQQQQFESANLAASQGVDRLQLPQNSQQQLSGSIVLIGSDQPKHQQSHFKGSASEHLQQKFNKPTKISEQLKIQKEFNRIFSALQESRHDLGEISEHSDA